MVFFELEAVGKKDLNPYIKSGFSRTKFFVIKKKS